MPRNHANNGRIYRAVIERAYPDGYRYTSMLGPYDTEAPAKALINRAQREAGAFGTHTAVGYIESAEVIWMKEA
ncbi:hypothetical protein [Streptomyces sp. NPDC055006]